MEKTFSKEGDQESTERNAWSRSPAYLKSRGCYLRSQSWERSDSACEARWNICRSAYKWQLSESTEQRLNQGWDAPIWGGVANLHQRRAHGGNCWLHCDRQTKCLKLQSIRYCWASGTMRKNAYFQVAQEKRLSKDEGPSPVSDGA